MPLTHHTGVGLNTGAGLTDKSVKFVTEYRSRSVGANPVPNSRSASRSGQDIGNSERLRFRSIPFNS